MSVWFAAIILVFFYIAQIPVNFAIMLRIASGWSFGTGSSLFEGRPALRNAQRRTLGEKKRLPWKRIAASLEKSAAVPAALQAAKYLLRRMRLEQLRAEGRISAPDAANTALIHGCAQMLQGALEPVFPGRVHMRLAPDFSSGQSEVLLVGMAQLRLGHIILAALIGAWNYYIRRNPNGKTSH